MFNFISKTLCVLTLAFVALMSSPNQSQAQVYPFDEAVNEISRGVSGIISTASSYLGMHERSNSGALRRVTKVNPARTPWCAAFVNGVLRQTGKRGTGSNAASSFRGYGHATSAPAPGDIALIRRRGGSGYHVGFFKGYVNKGGRRMVAVLGGNQGNRVSVSYYPAGKVSFRRG
jgi:uncharacterized protein (TIGR02594 family)